MKRLVALGLCLALIIVFAIPALALAEKSADTGKASAPGQVRKAEEGDAQGSAQGKAKGKAEDKGKGQSKAESAEESETSDADEGDEPKGKAKGKDKDKSAGQGNGHAKQSKEESGTTERKRSGIENALDRISANIAKAEQKIAEGTRKRVPPGLLRVYEKFIGWLGVEVVVPDDPTEPDEPGVEETMTPEPGDDASSSVAPEDPTS